MLGNTIRQIREDKMITMTDLTTGIMSISQLSKFERGETRISSEKFIQLLERLDVTMDEFLYLDEDNEFYSTEVLIDHLKKAYLEEDINKLLHYRKLQLTKGKKLNATMISVLAKNLSSNIQLDDQEIIALCDYLFTVKTWGRHEIILFGNTITALPFETIKIYIQELIRKDIQFYKIKSNKKLLVSTLINISIILLEQDSYIEVKQLLEKIKVIIDQDEYFLLEMNSYKFVNGLLLYKTGNKTEGSFDIEMSIKTFQFLECENLARSYEEYYKNLIANTKND